MDSFTEIGVFVRVVEAKSFTRAGKVLGLTPSGVSRVISRLESRLGARLLDRSTRSVGLTADGTAYYERCTKILRELMDADATVAQSGSEPRGRLRVDAPNTLGRYVLGPALPRFLLRYPKISVDFTLRDHVIDPVAEGIDVVVRMAELRESDLLHRQVGSLPSVVVGAPSYFEMHGRPRTPADLRHHDLIGFITGGAPLAWRFRTGGEDVTVAPQGRIHTNSVDAIRCATVSGLGLAHVFEYHLHDEIARGALEIVLADHQAPPRRAYALFQREKARMPKVRVFLDFLEEVMTEAGMHESEKKSRRS